MKLFTPEFFLSHHTPPIEIIKGSRGMQKRHPFAPIPIRVTKREMNRIVEACNWLVDKKLTRQLQREVYIIYMQALIEEYDIAPDVLYGVK